MFAVVVKSLCPSHSWICLRGTPLASSKLAQLCRYGIITTNGKSLYFQGVHAFAVIYSIPFPS